MDRRALVNDAEIIKDLVGMFPQNYIPSDILSTVPFSTTQ